MKKRTINLRPDQVTGATLFHDFSLQLKLREVRDGQELNVVAVITTDFIQDFARAFGEHLTQVEKMTATQRQNLRQAGGGS